MSFCIPGAPSEFAETEPGLQSFRRPALAQMGELITSEGGSATTSLVDVHPAVARLRERADKLAVSRACAARALRIMQALLPLPNFGVTPLRLWTPVTES